MGGMCVMTKILINCIDLDIGDILFASSVAKKIKEESPWETSCQLEFNVNYLQEILSTLDSENIEINFFGSDKSCLITDPGSSNLKYVVMPLLI